MMMMMMMMMLTLMMLMTVNGVICGARMNHSGQRAGVIAAVRTNTSTTMLSSTMIESNPREEKKGCKGANTIALRGPWRSL